MELKLKLKPTEIKQARKGLGLTFAKLAELTGVTTRTVQAYEAGEYPPSKTWIILFKQLEIQIKALRLQKKLKEEVSFL